MSKLHLEGVKGWVGSISRVEAEMRLEGEAAGTFVLREGEALNDRIFSILQRVNREKMGSCVLTVVAPGGKIAEYLIVYTPEGWTFYHDNPNLRDHGQYEFSPTLDDLLGKISMVAKRPLLGK